MANHYRGEVTVSVVGRAYTLRPTFQIMCEMEERIGLMLPQLLRRVAEKGLLASEILMLLAIATRHDGSRTFESETFLNMPAGEVDLHPLMPALARFLLGALGRADSGRRSEEGDRGENRREAGLRDADGVGMAQSPAGTAGLLGADHAGAAAVTAWGAAGAGTVR